MWGCGLDPLGVLLATKEEQIFVTWNACERDPLFKKQWLRFRLCGSSQSTLMQSHADARVKTTNLHLWSHKTIGMRNGSINRPNKKTKVFANHPLTIFPRPFCKHNYVCECWPFVGLTGSRPFTEILDLKSPSGDLKANRSSRDSEKTGTHEKNVMTCNAFL